MRVIISTLELIIGQLILLTRVRKSLNTHRKIMRTQRNDEKSARSNPNNDQNAPINFIQSPPHMNQFLTINHQLFTSPFLTSPYPVNTNMLIPTQPRITHQVHHMTSVHTQHVINTTPVHHNHALPPNSPSTYPMPITYPSPFHNTSLHVPPSTPYHHLTTSHSPYTNLPLPSHQIIPIHHHHHHPPQHPSSETLSQLLTPKTSDSKTQINSEYKTTNTNGPNQTTWVGKRYSTTQEFLVDLSNYHNLHGVQSRQFQQNINVLHHMCKHSVGYLKMVNTKPMTVTFVQPTSSLGRGRIRLMIRIIG